MGGNFIDNKITESGVMLMNKSNKGEANIEFTRVALGSGTLRFEQDASTMTSLNKEEVSLDIIRCNFVNSVANIRANFSSVIIPSEGFYYREIGVFARNSMDTEGKEILFCYGNSEDSAEWIPPTNSNYIKERLLDLEIVVSKAQNIGALINNNLDFSTYEEMDLEFEQLEHKINNLPKPIIDNHAFQTGIVGRLEARSTNYDAFYTHPNKMFIAPYKSNILFRAVVDVDGYAYTNDGTWYGAKLKLEIAGAPEGKVEKYRKIEVRGTKFNKHNDESVRSTVVFESVIYNQPANVPIVPQISIARISSNIKAFVYGYNVTIKAYPI